MKTEKLLSLILAGALSLALTACNNANQTSDGGVITTSEITEADETEVQTAEVTELSADTESTAENVIIDREGNAITVPDELNTIISAAPSVSEILSGLGVADKIIAADVYSADVDGINPDVCTLDFFNLNAEELISLSPDAVIINGISETGSSDPYKELKEAGINVVYIPSSTSIDSIKDDIAFLAAYTGTEEKGDELIAYIDAAVEDVTSKASTAEKKSVYFEIGAAPYLYSCGKGTFIDEILTLIGAENIYGDEEGWISNSEETVIAANPDVIITNVMYDGYDFNEIKERAGWEVITAVMNGDVYQVDSNATSRPSQNIVDGIYAVAKAVYPEIYGE